MVALTSYSLLEHESPTLSEELQIKDSVAYTRVAFLQQSGFVSTAYTKRKQKENSQ